jgi:hypothetical protein
VTALDMPQDYIQMEITDFLQDVKLPVQIKEELNNKLKSAVQWHLEKFVKLYLKLIKDPPTLGVFFAYITDSLPKMEDKEVCYLKRMPDGKIYVFKRAYCWEGIEAWKKCPEFRCLVQFPCCDLPCPYSSDHYVDPFEGLDQDEEAAIISHKEQQDKENSEKQS